MDVSENKRAMDCRLADTDWATLGRRIVSAAAKAAAVHVTEYGLNLGRNRSEASDAGLEDLAGENTKT